MKKAYIMLGRIGDVCNIIPAVEHEARTHNYKPALIVAKEYANLLDGCNYLDKIIWDGDFRDCNKAVSWAKRKFKKHEIINCAVYGHDYHFEKRTNSFNRESWRFSGCPVPWGRLPLTFDNRSDERERKILNALKIDGHKPVIVTALSGHSSPYPYGEKLLSYLKKELADFQIVDISKYKAERFYDLLGLFEVAQCLITIDSAPLHLANAVKDLPVISLIQDQKSTWHRSAWRPNHVLRLLYEETPKRFADIAEAAQKGFDYNKRKIYFITSYKLTADEETNRRNSLALRTRIEEAKHSPFYEFTCFNDYGRNATSIGDPHQLPFIRDMVYSGIRRATNDNDVIMLCNSDICFTPGITGWIFEEVERHGASFFHRYDFNKLANPLISEAEVSQGKWYPGSDAFVFTKAWWQKNGHIFPDMVFGREAWDMVFRNMIKRSGGSEIFCGIYHEKHDSFWERTPNRDNGGNSHNRKLAEKWLQTYGGDWNDWKNKVPYKY